MARNAPVVFGGITVQPGESRTIDLNVARLYTHSDMAIPIHVINGRQEGPCLFVSGVIHGDEIIGVEIIRRLLRKPVLKRLRGTLVAIPIVNVFGFINQSRYLPDRRDLNRFFPGSKTGSLTSRLADMLMTEVVSKCTHGIDLHSGSNHRENLPQLRAYLDDPETLRLAQAFGAPVIMDANLLEGSLRQAAKDSHIQMLLYEGGEALRFNESAIRMGMSGVIAVMRAIRMLPEVKRRSRIKPVVSQSSTWVRASISGLVSSQLQLGQQVSEGEKIGDVVDPYGEAREPIIAKADGIVVGRLNLPLVHRGDAIFHIARIQDPAAGEASMETYLQEFEPDL